MSKKITKYFVSMLLGLALTTNIAIADPKEMPKYLSFEQFNQLVNDNDIHFLGRFNLELEKFINNNHPAHERIKSLYIYDMEDFLNKPKCESDSVVATGKNVLLVKSISKKPITEMKYYPIRSEFVWQELFFVSDCDLRYSLSKLQRRESDWKQFSRESTFFLDVIKRLEGWAEDSIHIIISDTSSPLIGVEELKYLARCHDKQYLKAVFGTSLPSTSLCL